MTTPTASLLPPARSVFFNANGQLLAGGNVYTYALNGTTPQTTWQDPNQATPNSNPITLDSAGSCLLYGDGDYILTVTDSSGNAIPGYSGQSQDPLSLINAAIAAIPSSSASFYYAIGTGSANAIVAAYNPAITSYTDGAVYYVRPNASNTGATTFNGGGGVLSVVGAAGALQGGEIVVGKTVGLQYSALNSNFLLVSGAAQIQGVTATQTNQLTTLGQVDTLVAGFAALAGSSSQQFSAANGTTGNQVVNVSQFSQTLSASTLEQKIPGPSGSLLVIVGSFSATNASSGTVTLPGGGFPNEFVAVFLQPQLISGTNNSYAAAPISLSQFNWAWDSTTSGTYTMQYVAFGY